MQSSGNENNYQRQCKICKGSVHEAYPPTTILGKYLGKLLKCSACGFEFFNEPEVWLAEAYNAPIANTDTGIVTRSLGVHRILSSFFGLTKPSGKILDWGSGSGLLVRLLRDDGHDCYGLEPYTTPVLAPGHTWKGENVALTQAPYRAVVAFEVVEHLPAPKEFFEIIFGITETFIFSTELAETNTRGSEWWYYCTETGQHICFYTARSLAHLAKENGYMYAHTRNKSMHIMTKSSLDLALFKFVAGRKRAYFLHGLAKFIKKIRGESSLLIADHLAAKEALINNQAKRSA